ncbi:mechanosensitive ion channel domain-containing protein [Sphingomonas sp. S-NIH.Pt15_0812]|uniref:mechanosensitive ion channel family protein n=1 Tax=Sphingomonas sp. S-NIH.Pt15_0812 TaxID=1920129 RepID=UPI000F7FA2E8|nr:mechanosensitive ion channel domain-containing protein [Sphingomonas sp. S-NIH.Pt15_0812]
MTRLRKAWTLGLCLSSGVTSASAGAAPGGALSRADEGGGLFANLANDAGAGLALMTRQLAQPVPATAKLAGFFVLIALAFFVMQPARSWALQRLSGFLKRQHSHSKLAIFGRALGAVLITLACVSVGGLLMLMGVVRYLPILPEVKTLVGVLFAGVVTSGLGLGLGRALRSPDAKELRPLQLPAGLGQTIGFYPFAAAIMLGTATFIDQASRILDASQSSWGVAQAVLAIAEALLIGRFLVLAGRARERVVSAAADDQGPSLPAIFSLTAVVWTALAVALGALLLGHTRFAVLLLQEILWVALILTTAWLMTRFIDALVAQLLGEDKRAARFATGVVGVQKTRIDQGALLASAMLSVIVWLFALLLVLSPLQGGGTTVVAQVRPSPMIAALRTINLSPQTILTAIAVLVGGIAVTRMIRGWLERRFLPSTNLDIGARTSITTGLSYVGIIFALVATSGTLGLQLEKITLIASALTVGIGFGLQAIIQNFVSGVIMLFERPVKIGDRVSVSGSEGKIRRMRVRATELVADDGSIAIIPNSAFISTTVVNKSAVEAPSEIALTVTITGAVDADGARKMLAQHLSHSSSVSHETSPTIRLEKFGAVEWVFAISVEPSRQAQGRDVRSDILFGLSAIRADGITLAAC